MDNVAQWLVNACRLWGGRIALVTSAGNYTYSQLEAYSSKFAARCSRAGLRQGDRIIVYGPNSAEVVISIFGALRIGCVFVCVHPGTPPARLMDIVEDSKARMIVASKILPDLQAEHLQYKVYLHPSLCKANETDEWMPFTEWINEGEAGSMPVVNPGLAALIYTSGSTGKPKGVMSTHRNIIFTTDAINRFLSHSPEDRVLSYLPLSFDYGLYQLFLTFSRGSRLYLRQADLFAAEVKRLIIHEQITGFPGLRSLFTAVTGFKSTIFPDVRYITNTGDAVPSAMLERIKERFPRSSVYLMYGVTECKRVSYLPPEMLEANANSVGVPLWETKTDILDGQGESCPPHVSGELLVSGEHVCAGYWNDEEASAATFICRNGERYLKTGDLFYKDEEGLLYYVGRKDAMFKSKGYRVNPLEIENVLAEQFKEIKDIAVVGIPERLYGKKVCAAVILRTMDIDKKQFTAQLKAYCGEHLELWKRPEYWLIVSSFPLTTSGKIDRQQIVRLITAAVEAGGIR